MSVPVRFTREDKKVAIHPSAPDALQDFLGEDEPRRDDVKPGAKSSAASAAAPAAAAAISKRTWMIAGIAVLAAVLAGGVTALLKSKWSPLRPAETPQGRVTINTVPAGAEVIVDEKNTGLTPITLMIPAGPHSIVVRRGSEERTLPVNVTAGVEMAHHIEFAAAAVPTATTGRLVVTTDPAGARVTVDGKARGNAPVTLADLPPGEHSVAIASDTGTSERKVLIEAGITASVVFTLPKAAGPAAGWLAVTAPFEVQMFENTDLVGTGASAKVMLPAGRHSVRLVNDALGYEDTRNIEVTAGKVSNVKVDAPKVAISANARPWADVIIDGNNAGQTPLANVAVAIGKHQLVFRHPQLGEQRQDVTVTAKGPNRFSADLTKK